MPRNVHAISVFFRLALADPPSFHKRESCSELTRALLQDRYLSIMDTYYPRYKPPRGGPISKTYTSPKQKPLQAA